MLNKTSCKKCVFAVYEELTQVGCKRGMLDRYRANGDEVLECYDEQAEFNVIEGRNCPYHRDKKWAKRFTDEATIDTVDNVLHKETRFGFNVILYLSEIDIDLLTKTVDSISMQSEYPSHVTVVIPSSHYSASVLPTMKSVFADYKGKWNVRFTNKKKQDGTDDNTPRKLNHLINKTSKCQYMVFSDIGYEFEDDFFKNINDAVVDHLVQFAAIKPSPGSSVNGLVIPTSVYEHWYIMGDQDKPVYNNIKEYSCEQQDEAVVTMHKIKLSINQQY